MKRLTRIRLINWHYFINETIEVDGSFLISGENTSGKSTVLDAIQLVLTTNTRKFNTAANEKSKRDLRGYVRCKTGDEENAFLRKGTVISYVALEFFEETKSSYFTMGAMMESPDEDARLSTKWFVEECRLDEISFITGGRPSMKDEFRRKDRKIVLIGQMGEAKQRFGRRLGNLEDRFFDMIPKSLAFKPMDNVKDFINKFILSEKRIEVHSLRENIRHLKEFEELMAKTRSKIESLEGILQKEAEIQSKEKDRKVNEILLKKAELEKLKNQMDRLERDTYVIKGKLANVFTRRRETEEAYERENNRLIGLEAALQSNEVTRLIQGIENQIGSMEKEKEHLAEKLGRLSAMLQKCQKAFELLFREGISTITRKQIDDMGNSKFPLDEKLERAYEMEGIVRVNKSQYNDRLYGSRQRISQLEHTRRKLQDEIRDLQNKKLTYPQNTVNLREEILSEFKKRGIRANVWIFSELLEITDPSWQNAIEGYLNTQRFYLLVDPRYYQVALDTYNRVKERIHSVGLINTDKLNLELEAERSSLAYFVASNNRYARSYAYYLLNRVTRCPRLEDLKKHKVAITEGCMLYQNYAARKIDEKIYNPPFIGAIAYKKQLEIREAELEETVKELGILRKDVERFETILDALDSCHMETVKDNLPIPDEISRIEENLFIKRNELEKAKSNPTYLEIKGEISQCREKVERLLRESREYVAQCTALEKDMETNRSKTAEIEREYKEREGVLNNLRETESDAFEEGIRKYEDQSRSKSPETIITNFSPHTLGLENTVVKLTDILKDQQRGYCSLYDCDFGTGREAMEEYVREHHKQVSSEIVKYEDQLAKAKDNCELEFKESFLARLKENIESARLEFKQLNKALRGIYYGEDSYRFEITNNKKKEKLYQMIMSDQNTGGSQMFRYSFESQYQEEINDLFEKLTAYDDLGDKVILEYTDYRSYLDYDIIVEKMDGSSQRFSNIYGEKSGGETQTPYYVAIAASFVQLYRAGNTIRIIMLDEAFDKMDDNRIAAMMDFFNSQNFQIILATPPGKMEIIGEKVDTVLLAIREGNNAIVEVYDL
ncbi:ATP-binding protein [Gudongella sp. SC589]|uniref:ATP-binding protein n=1 Tax=Gudongella sp. SC589 TaxID=3385990 RepID=UPI003904D86D